MKKNLLFCAFIAVSFMANAVSPGTYYFGSGETTGNLTPESFTLQNLVFGGTDSNNGYFYFNYPGSDGSNVLCYISVTSMPDFVFSYKNSGTKNKFFRVYDTYIYTDGKGVTLTISNVTVGDSIIITTKAKGSNTDTWTVTGATTSSTLENIGNDWVTLRLLATETTVVLTETNGGFDISQIEIKSNLPPNAINMVNANKIIANIKYYDLVGKEIPKDTKGLVIKKITYADGSVEVVREFIIEK